MSPDRKIPGRDVTIQEFERKSSQRRKEAIEEQDLPKRVFSHFNELLRSRGEFILVSEPTIHDHEMHVTRLHFTNGGKFLYKEKGNSYQVLISASYNYKSNIDNPNNTNAFPNSFDISYVIERMEHQLLYLERDKNGYYEIRGPYGEKIVGLSNLRKVEKLAKKIVNQARKKLPAPNIPHDS